MNFADNPIVYFAITDRFYNGNPANDHSYGRQMDGKQEIGTFHGGDLAGLTDKLKSGYFKQLGSKRYMDYRPLRANTRLGAGRQR